MAARDTLSEKELSCDKHEDTHPSPTDLEAFLPWACGQLQLPFVPVINKTTLSAPNPRVNTTRGKVKDETTNVDSQSVSITCDAAIYSVASNADLSIYIDAIYDNSDNLVQLKLNHNLNIPVTLLKIFSLIARFHPRLTTIYINKGLNQSGLYQLNKIVNAAKMTEVTLDNVVLKEANYYILLDDNSTLKYLSLARCKLNDSSVKIITSKLYCPSKASKNLSVLNLSSNTITDEGAICIGNVLRANRQLTYLNLSGNMISDVGADSILSTLVAFPLTTEEISQKKARKFTYMKEKEKTIQQTVEQMRIDYEKRYARKSRSKPLPIASKKTKSIEGPSDSERGSITVLDSIWIEKAEAAAEEMLGPFQDAFNYENTMISNGKLYCYGNNVLCYINFAYNNLTYFSVKRLLEVINIQREWDRKPRGLINVCIEGNNLPDNCQELADIDIFIEIGLVRMSNMSTIAKKKNVMRTK